MIPDVGYLAMVTALVGAVYATIASLYGFFKGEERWVNSARHATMTLAPLLGLSSLTLIYALVVGDFQLKYVATTSSRDMPLFLKVTALWGGQSGSLLFWSFLMASFTFIVMLRRWDEDRELLPHVIFVTAGTLVFFVGLTTFVANPFEKLSFIPPDGQGLNPLLRHPGMVAHPPTLYLGYVGFVIPYAFAMAALVTRRTDPHWIRVTRRWTLAAWLFLSLGLLLGGRWAYDVLGWGGYWAWDPVENAAFMPWLTGTAFLHSVMIQEKRGMLKVWNMVLIILTYGLVIFGTFITRSGVISSVHSFAQSAVGPLFFSFIAVTAVASVATLLRRLDDLKSENRLDALLSREAAFLLNNMLFITLTFSVFIGTISPMVSELVTGEKITVGPPWFDRVTAPQFALLLALMGIAPLMAWRKTAAQRLGRSLWWPFLIAVVVVIGLFLRGVHSWGALLGFLLVTFVGVTTLWEYVRGVIARRRARGEPWLVAFWRLAGRNRRRYGGYIVHLGVVCMALGIIGTEFFQQDTEGTLRPGESLEIGGFRTVYRTLRTYPGPGDLIVTEATVEIYQGDQLLKTVHPKREFYQNTQQTMTIPALRSTMAEDVYVLLTGWESGGATATFRVYINPLVNWLWLGGLIFVVGTLVAGWPDFEAKRRMVMPRLTIAPQQV